MMVEEAPNRNPAPGPLVLVAAGDDSFGALIEYIFTSTGFGVRVARSGDALAGCLKDQMPDVMLVESVLPDIEIPVLCTRLRLERRTRSMPIIVFAGEGDEHIQKELLESGVDEYIARPFSPEKLLMSTRMLLREANRMSDSGADQCFTFLDLELDLSSYRVRRNGQVIHLAPTEFRLLHHLMKHPRRVYSRDELQHAAWPKLINFGPRTVDVHMGRLRAALNGAGDRDLIRTVRSVGYALSD